MELSQSFKKRYSLGVEVDNCPGTAAGFCVAGSTYGADKATNQKEIDNFLIQGNTIEKNFSISFLNGTQSVFEEKILTWNRSGQLSLRSHWVSRGW